jgi:hypothetical protein
MRHEFNWALLDSNQRLLPCEGLPGEELYPAIMCLVLPDAIRVGAYPLPPQANFDGLANRLRIDSQMEVISFGHADAGMAQGRTDQLDAGSPLDASRRHLMPDSMQGGGSLNQVPFFEAAQGLSQRPPRPASAAIVAENCALGFIHFLEQANSLVDQEKRFRAARDFAGFVGVYCCYASLQIHVGPIQDAQFAQPAARQAKEKQRRLEKLVCLSAYSRQGGIVEGRSGLRFSIGHTGKGIASYATLPHGPVERRVNLVGFGPSGGRGFPPPIRFDPIAELVWPALINWLLSIRGAKAGECASALRRAFRAMGLYELTVMQIASEDLGHGDDACNHRALPSVVGSAPGPQS